LKCALHTAGQLHVHAGKKISAGLAILSTNQSLRNEGTITGRVECSTSPLSGTINGKLTTSVAPRDLPASTVPESYAKLGTQITPGNTIDKLVIGPGYNPWGQPNQDGVYVIRTSSDLTIRRSRIYGTLVVICPGHKLTIDNTVLIHPVRSDYPTLIVDGNAEFGFTGGDNLLSESALAMNYNPAGVPYGASADWDCGDVYPSAIYGLVHVRGTVKLSATALIRGVLLCESTATLDAVAVSGDNTILEYSDSLYRTPPPGYTTSVPMLVDPGSYVQSVQP
jgi:hypothetical protein